MSIVSLAVSPGNPVTSQHVVDALSELGPIQAAPAGLDDWTAILAGAHETFNKVADQPDYVPPVDEVRFPRKNVHRPEPKDNTLNAWAWKVDIQDTEQSRGGLLAGKTFAIKDNVTIKGGQFPPKM